MGRFLPVLVLYSPVLQFFQQQTGGIDSCGPARLLHGKKGFKRRMERNGDIIRRFDLRPHAVLYSLNNIHRNARPFRKPLPCDTLAVSFRSDTFTQHTGNIIPAGLLYRCCQMGAIPIFQQGILPVIRLVDSAAGGDRTVKTKYATLAEERNVWHMHHLLCRIGASG